MTHPTGTISRVATNPRNPWTRLLAALELSELGEKYDAAKILETLRYNDSVDRKLFDYAAQLVYSGPRYDPGSFKVNIPSDYSRGIRSVFHPAFRIISQSADFPKYYPSGMALPSIVGNRNDYTFIEEAATLGSSALPDLTIDIIHPFGSKKALGVLMRSLETQRVEGRLRLHVFGGNSSVPRSSDVVELVHHSASLPGGEGNSRLLRIAEECDVLLFVDGTVALEPSVLQRIAQVASVSDRVIHALTPVAFGDSLTPFNTSLTKDRFTHSYPFRNVHGFNFAVTSRLFRQTGGLDSRFSHSYNSARELCFRLYNKGCYFRPIGTNEVRGFDVSNAADDELFKQLCPNHWDRSATGKYEIPKISIYIPAYNAARYIVAAVESVLDQDIDDLEVCIADDGSRDDTLLKLETRFADNPKVRWVAGPNGGIGFASNRAVSMARGIYVGQLDSDDRLKPGAVRRLSAYLDENPNVACCYSSCERVDALGSYLQNEYNWPVFSREKMLVTSITHHFRMFRKQAWERTEKFREDIINAVDYDMFLKLSEVGDFHHLDQILYQRRWHDANTSSINESHQTSNGYRVQCEALKRQRLFHFWDIAIPNHDEPRRITYERRTGRKFVTFWPYYRSNHYQRMLYAPHMDEMEICAGTIDAALREIQVSACPRDHIFHLHWLNFLFNDEMAAEEAQGAADLFLSKLEEFKAHGGTVAWTIHNTLSHDAIHREVESSLSERLTEVVDILHFHSASSVAEVAETFPIPQEKVRIARHGNYLGAYPDTVSSDLAREYLGLSPDDDVIVFIGQVRAYKGLESLIGVFRNLLTQRPNLKLVVAGAARGDPLANLAQPLTTFESSRLDFINRYLEDSELQVFLRAGDFAVFPYRKILTSGSLMLALSFELPVIMPDVGMARDVLKGSRAGILYDGSVPELEKAIRHMLEAKDNGELPEIGDEARRVAKANPWQNLFE